MSDPVARLNAALEGRYAIERELGEGGMATVYTRAFARRPWLFLLLAGCSGPPPNPLCPAKWEDPRKS